MVNMLRIWQKLKEALLSKDYEWKKYNFPLIGVVLLICLISVFTLYIIGSGYNTSADWKKQLLGILLGLFIMVFVSIIDYHSICRFVIIYYIIITALVAATRFSPLGTDNDKDAYRWLDFPGFQLQPSELCKLMIIFAVAVAITAFQNKLKTILSVSCRRCNNRNTTCIYTASAGFVIKHCYCIYRCHYDICIRCFL